MINRDKKFITGFIIGKEDADTGKPFDIWQDVMSIEHQKGYTAGFNGKGNIVIEIPDETPVRLNVGDRVKRIRGNNSPSLDVPGTIEAIGTELGLDYASVRWDGNETGFCAQVPKYCLVKVD